MRSYPDVAILGAGFAGLAAARALAEQGLSVELIEARERVGGRACTDHPEASLPAELGPEYVHGDPGEMRALFRDAGIEGEPITDVHHARRGERLVCEPSVWNRFGAFLRHAPPPERDESARDYLRRRRLGADDAFLFATLIEGYYAAPLADISIASIAADAGGTGRDQDIAMCRPRGGYGGLATWLLQRVKDLGGVISYGRIVRAVDWRSGRVRIDTQVGDLVSSVLARRVIVTLPLGVLLATGEDTIRFSPGLGAHARAMDDLAMGHVVKVVACFAAATWREYESQQLHYVHAEPGVAFPTFWLRSRGTVHQVTAWAGGTEAKYLEGLTSDEVLARMLTDFAATVGMPRARLESVVDHHHFHDYTADPFSRGAYSYTRVGGHRAAETLATPLGDVLYFAGEATDSEYQGTVAGAVRSGQRAAHQILERLALRHAA